MPLERGDLCDTWSPEVRVDEQGPRTEPAERLSEEGGDRRLAVGGRGRRDDDKLNPALPQDRLEVRPERAYGRADGRVGEGGARLRP